MRRVTHADSSSDWLREVADLLALGYLRARKRDAAQKATARRALSQRNSLDDVAPRGMFATGDSATSTEG